MSLKRPIELDLWWGLRAAHLKGAPMVGPTRAHLGAPTRTIKGGEDGGEGAPHPENPGCPLSSLLPPLSFLLLLCIEP